MPNLQTLHDRATRKAVTIVTTPAAYQLVDDRTGDTITTRDRGDWSRGLTGLEDALAWVDDPARPTQ